MIEKKNNNNSSTKTFFKMKFIKVLQRQKIEKKVSSSRNFHVIHFELMRESYASELWTIDIIRLNGRNEFPMLCFLYIKFPIFGFRLSLLNEQTSSTSFIIKHYNWHNKVWNDFSAEIT